MNQNQIDWDSNIKQLSTSYVLTDKQVAQGLNALEHARELYGNCKIEDVPQIIMIYDNNNNMVHKIVTRNYDSQHETVHVHPKQNKTKIILALGCLAFSVGIVYYSISHF